MAKDADKLNTTGLAEETFSLEEILAEFSGGEAGPPKASPAGQTREETRAAPVLSIPDPQPPAPPPAKEADMPLKCEELQADDDEDEELPDNVVPFPGGEEREESPLLEGLRRLRDAEAAYAGRMFEEEEPDPEAARREELIPGADVEEDFPMRERRPRPAPEPAPDLPPAELAGRYGRGLRSLRLRSLAVFFLSGLMLLPAAAPALGLPLPVGLADSSRLQVYLSAGLLAAAMLLSLDVLGRGLLGLVRGRPGMDALTALACAATLADSLTMLSLDPREGSLPYCSAAALGLAFGLWGTYLKRRGLWQACRTAAASAEPYLVTLDEDKWNGRDAYAKTSGPAHGFGSQIQSDDGAQRMFRPAVPLLMLACLLFSMISALGNRRPEHMLWCLSAMLTASASYSGLLCFGMPMASLSARLSKIGAAVAGWEGVRFSVRGNGILLNDADLFPPGTVSLNGIKVFGDFPVEKVVAVTATLIRDSGCGLEKVFHDLLRTQGATFRRASDFRCHEGGGFSAVIREEEILVGTASFMSLMEVALPQGLGVKNAVFCAIEGELAGLFALNYTLHSSVSPSLSALIANRVNPILATRDFNLLPAMLRQRFKLPADRMEFPTAQRRMELSDPRQTHSPLLTAVLCREGLAPYSEAVVGARRLRRATRMSAALAVTGSVAGVLLSFYLTYVAAFGSLSAANLTVFLLLWSVPTFLISGWVDRY